jgi:hypothetical protein
VKEMSKEPEFFITTQDNPEVRPVPFVNLYAQRDFMTSMTLLWDCNSYHINIIDKYFIINGGRRIPVTGKLDSIKVLYARRNNVELTVTGGKEVKRGISYLLGFEAVNDNNLTEGPVKHELMLHISSDGKVYTFRDKR